MSACKPLSKPLVKPLCTPPCSSPENERARRPDTHLGRLLSPLPGFALSDSTMRPGYREACDFVAACFERQYGASLTHFMPWLMTMHCIGGLSAVTGLRPAQEGQLFLEQYLDAPIESLVSAVAGVPVDRGTIVEVGNLVASQRGASQLLFLLMATTLREAGHTWVVFTATRTLRNTLSRLGVGFTEIGEASLDRLPSHEQSAWGSYYDTGPRVLALRLDSVNGIIARRPLLRQALRVYAGAVEHMAHVLAAH